MNRYAALEIVISVLVGVMAACGASPKPNEPRPPQSTETVVFKPNFDWQSTAELPAEVIALRSVACSRERIDCFAAGQTRGYRGILLRSRDQARTWQTRRVVDESVELGALTCLSDLRCFALGTPVKLDGGILVATADGGENWQVHPLPGQAIAFASCLGATPALTVCRSIPRTAKKSRSYLR